MLHLRKNHVDKSVQEGGETQQAFRRDERVAHDASYDRARREKTRGEQSGEQPRFTLAPHK